MSIFMLAAMFREKQLNEIINERVDSFIDTLVDDTKDVVKSELSVSGFTNDGIGEVCPNFEIVKTQLKRELGRYLAYSMVIR